MKRPKVFLTGGEGIGWATDHLLKKTRQALEGVVEFSNLSDCEVVHSIWWEPLASIPEDQLIGKRVVCYVSGDPFRYLSEPGFSRVTERVSIWTAPTTESQRKMQDIGLSSVLIPCLIDCSVFRPLPSEDAELVALQQRFAIPSDSYLIGNFHRDSEGRDLTKPKLAKGPDVFLEIVRILRNRGCNVHVILAGPRRHWMRKQLRELDIPFTFVGQEVEADDLSLNVLPQLVLNLLYNSIHLFLASSRSEAGPASIMEAAASRCKIISTRVGLAPDVLEPQCLYSSVPEAVDIIAKDIEQDHLRATLEPQYQRVVKRHTPEAVRPLFQELYAHIWDIPPFYPPGGHRRGGISKLRVPVRKIARWVSHRSQTVMKVAILFGDRVREDGRFVESLERALVKKGALVVDNRAVRHADVCLLASAGLEVVEQLVRLRERRSPPIVHWILPHLFCGSDTRPLEAELRLNAQVADSTILPSAWAFQRAVGLGYRPKNAAIIYPAVDRETFHGAKSARGCGQRVRLISAAPMDGKDESYRLSEWLAQHLDQTQFEYTVIGDTLLSHELVRGVLCPSGEALAQVLNEHDIYIALRGCDSSRGFLIEALTCGLPTLYLDEGDNRELVGYGGLPFSGVDEVIPNLERLVSHYSAFQRLIVASNLDEVAEKFVAVLRLASERR